MEKHPISDHYARDDKFLNALAEAFRLQEAILNTTDLAIISITASGTISSFNRAAEELLGHKAEAVIDQADPLIFLDLDEILHRSQAISEEAGSLVEPTFETLVFKARHHRGATRDEWTMVRADGTRFPAVLSVSALHDEQDALAGFVIIATDTSNLKELVRASEQKFRTLAENIPGAIYLCHNDESYSMIYLNDQIEKITGYPASDFISGKLSITQLYHPDDISAIYAQVEDALARKISFHLRYRLKHRTGDWRWIDEVGVGVYKDDKLIMLEGFMSDITAQQEAAEKLEKVGDENLRVFNNAVNFNVIAGFDGHFKRISTSWKVFGWSEEELKSKPFIEFVHPDDIAATRKALEYVIDGNNLHSFENRYRTKDGTYRWLLWGSASDIGNRLIYASAVDITERKKYEDQLINSKQNVEAIAVKLQEQNRQLDEFAHIISHNLRSPVGNIQALIKLLNDQSTIQDYRAIFDKLKNVAKNLGATMNDLMDTLKVKTQTDLERTEIRFKELLDKVVQSLEGELITAEASVTFDFNNVPTIIYPKPYLESIFQNLLSNAIKYRSSKRKPAIHFETSLRDDSVILRVSDNGLGIDLEKFGDKVFGLHRTFHSHEEARGVGLFLIKTQIESMGGSITVDSSVDKGTTFTIRFN